MERKEFLKRLGLAAIAFPLMSACKDDEVTSSSGACTTTATETAGPFPTKSPSTLVLNDIRSDRTGVPLTINITVQNKSNNCNALAGAIVDIWHCDKDGYYSEYGGSGMQSADFTSVHFLRGRQTTNSDGVAGFTSIFPGWYSGRAPHIHVHIYNANGNSLLVTQIAFPKSTTDTVYTGSSFYSARGKQDTTNESDNVFSDGVSTELATLDGSVANGYSLTHTVVVTV
jgi:protocatechuate 3,4-dioxygenase beta subunit